MRSDLDDNKSTSSDKDQVVELTDHRNCVIDMHSLMQQQHIQNGNANHEINKFS